MNKLFLDVWNTLVQLQLPGVIIGAVLTIFVGRVLERSKDKQKFLEKFSKIIIDVKDNGWVDWPNIGESEFQLMCSRLMKYNRDLGFSLKLEYYNLWVFASIHSYEKGKKMEEEEKKEPAPKPDYTKMSIWNTAPKLDTLHYALLTEGNSKSNVARILKEIRKNECNKEFCTIFLWGSENAFETAYELNDYKKTFSILDVSGPPAGYWDGDSDSYLYYDESFKFD